VHLSVPALTLGDIYVLLLLGVLMFFAWRSGQRDATLGFTCLMLLFGTVSTVLGCLRGMGIDVVPIVLGNIALQLALAMNWTAMRTFVGRPPHLPGILAGALLWGGLCLGACVLFIPDRATVAGFGADGRLHPACDVRALAQPAATIGFAAAGHGLDAASRIVLSAAHGG